MSMEITQILPTQSGLHTSRDTSPTERTEAAVRAQMNAQRVAQAEIQARTESTNRAIEKQKQDFQQAIEELRSVSQVFNRRLSFNYNEDLEMVIVKVIDRETDKVIKELPPDALQRVHMRIKEAIGLLLDETV